MRSAFLPAVCGLFGRTPARGRRSLLAFTTNKLDPLFENNDLKASGTGIYQEVFDNIDYGDETPEEAVNGLLDGMESVGYTIA